MSVKKWVMSDEKSLPKHALRLLGSEKKNNRVIDCKSIKNSTAKPQKPCALN